MSKREFSKHKLYRRKFISKKYENRPDVGEQRNEDIKVKIIESEHTEEKWAFFCIIFIFSLILILSGGNNLEKYEELKLKNHPQFSILTLSWILFFILSFKIQYYNYMLSNNELRKHFSNLLYFTFLILITLWSISISIGIFGISIFLIVISLFIFVLWIFSIYYENIINFKNKLFIIIVLFSLFMLLYSIWISSHFS